VSSCNCIGPQGGQPKCPCMMRGLVQRDGRWIEPERDLGPVTPLVRIGDNVAKLLDWMDALECPTCVKITTHPVARGCRRDECPVRFAQKRPADAPSGVTATGVSDEVPGRSSIPNPNRVTKP
jgi:hypothetical protein